MTKGRMGPWRLEGVLGELDMANFSYLKSSSMRDLTKKCRHVCACEISLTQAVGNDCGKGLDALTSS